MADESYRAVAKMLRDEQSKHTYFLLAASGAAIGFAVTQTQSTAISWYQIPLGVAVILWALSFFFGSRHLAYVNSTLFANAELLKVQSGEHSMVGNNQALIEAASKGITDAMNTNSDRANRLGHLQFWSLVAGAIFYLAWHVIEMCLRYHPN